MKVYSITHKPIRNLERLGLIPVGVGIYADGWVEVNGPEVREGTRIVLPK